MAKKKKTIVTPINGSKCDDCIYSEPFYGENPHGWNCNAEGKPITMHCHREEKVRKGIFYGTPACTYFQKKQV